MNNPDVLLKYFLKKLENTSNNMKLLEVLKSSNLLVNDFEERYILNNNSRYFSEIVKKEHKPPLMLYFLTDSDGMPYKIELLQDINWKIKSFFFQCMGCFGEDEKCLVCDGTGWGVN